MDQNIFYTIFYSIIAILMVLIYLPVFKAKTAGDLSDMLKSRPFLAKLVARKGARNYLLSSIFYGISLVGFCLIASDDNSPVDMDFAAIALIGAFAITMAKIWKLRLLIGRP